MTFTGFIGKVCMWPLRAIIRASVALGIHPNTLTLIGVLINVAAACALGGNRFLLAGVIMIVANIFDFMDGKLAHQTNHAARFGAGEVRSARCARGRSSGSTSGRRCPTVCW